MNGTNDGYYAMLHQVRVLGRLVEENLSSRCRVGFLMKMLSEDADANYDWPIETINEAFSEFKKLPRAERKRVLNGWNPDVDMMSMEDFKSFEHIDTLPANVLHLNHGKRGLTGVVRTVLDDVMDVDRVRLVIQQGQTKRQVIDALEDMLETVRESFAEIVATANEAGCAALEAKQKTGGLQIPDGVAFDGHTSQSKDAAA